MSAPVLTPRPPAGQLSREQLLELYHYMKLNRMVEEKLTNLYRQGKVVGGLYRSLGQEACSVGSAYALERGDIFTPMIRNLGAIFVRGGKPRDVFAQYMAKASGPTRGRDLNVHFGWISEDGSMPSVISMLGDMIPILTGAVVVIPTLFMGALISESFFGIPGLGSRLSFLTSRSISRQVSHST